MFKVDNVGAFAKGIFEFEKGLDRAVGEVYRGWSIRIFHDLVKKTLSGQVTLPQIGIILWIR